MPAFGKRVSLMRSLFAASRRSTVNRSMHKSGLFGLGGGRQKGEEEDGDGYGAR